MAEASALEAPFRAGRARGQARPRPAARGRVPLRHRYRRLRSLDPRAPAALAGVRLDRRARRRLAPAVDRPYGDALRGQGAARGLPALLSDLPAQIIGIATRFRWRATRRRM